MFVVETIANARRDNHVDASEKPTLPSLLMQGLPGRWSCVLYHQRFIPRRTWCGGGRCGGDLEHAESETSGSA